MKTFLTVLFATLCAATSYGQIIKTLGYNTTNGRVVYAGTNPLFFTNQTTFSGGINSSDLSADNLTVEGAIYFTDVLTNVSVTRTNLGLPLAALTNANVTNFRSAIGLGWSALTNTNEANFRAAISVARAPTWAYKTTNQTNATTNLVSDSALTFTAAANTRYAVELFVSAAESVAQLRAKINTATNATTHGNWIYYNTADATILLTGVSVTNATNVFAFDASPATFSQKFVVSGPTNSNSTVTFQFSPADTNGSAVIRAGSYLRAEVIE